MNDGDFLILLGGTMIAAACVELLHLDITGATILCFLFGFSLGKLGTHLDRRAR